MEWMEFEKEYAKDVLSGDPWKERIEGMAGFITEAVKSICDLGAGEMYLKRCLAPDIKYYPVDFIKRTDETILCDFNRYEFPGVKTDAYFVSGCLEYIRDYKWFIEKMCMNTPIEIVISYFAVKEKDRGLERGWTYNGVDCRYENALTEQDLILLFKKNGYEAVKRGFDEATSQPYFSFMPLSIAG